MCCGAGPASEAVSPSTGTAGGTDVVLLKTDCGILRRNGRGIITRSLYSMPASFCFHTYLLLLKSVYYYLVSTGSIWLNTVKSVCIRAMC